MKQSKQMEYF